MLSATEQQEHALGQLEHLKQFFLSLFICSTGLVMSPTFLAQHMRVLAGGLVITVLAKTVLVRARAPCLLWKVVLALRKPKLEKAEEKLPPLHAPLERCVPRPFRHFPV